ncbi:hypothetical protein C8250_015660 [Streptomyces sp. So13.3]|uniref:hypothetical protein n=1 Tax=unclassified Streptomyces TaxID=2593676 RepID=UPI00110598CC|nr:MULTISPECIES: hypothetical protein [unclassified Streptomyces]NEA75407.1 hypothetical protein [Streptomyces sp. SID13588]QNA73162.1 hypothetical protein C8250_015660 [Streptomyces sp. So13.3]
MTTPLIADQSPRRPGASLATKRSPVPEAEQHLNVEELKRLLAGMYKWQAADPSFGQAAGACDAEAPGSGSTSVVHANDLASAARPPDLLLLDGNTELECVLVPRATPLDAEEVRLLILLLRSHSMKLAATLGQWGGTPLALEAVVIQAADRLQEMNQVGASVTPERYVHALAQETTQLLDCLPSTPAVATADLPNGQ